MATENHWQLSSTLTVRELLDRPITLEHLQVKEPDGGHRVVVVTPGDVLLLDQMQFIGTNLPQRKLARTAVEVGSQPTDNRRPYRDRL